MALRKHDPQLMFHAQQCAENIRVKCGCIGLCRLVCKWSRFTFGAGVIDGNVQASETLDRLVHKVAHVIFIADVSTNKKVRTKMASAPSAFNSATNSCPSLSRRPDT